MSGIPRRCRLDRLSLAEKTIHDAIVLVEEMPVDEHLAEARALLLRAQDRVADFVDKVPPRGTLPQHGVEEALATALTHGVLSKYAGVSHSGTVLDGTTIAREILGSVREVLEEHRVRVATAKTDPDELAPESQELKP